MQARVQALVLVGVRKAQQYSSWLCAYAPPHVTCKQEDATSMALAFHGVPPPSFPPGSCVDLHPPPPAHTPCQL